MAVKKGQMFIIATLFIIVLIVLIRNMVGTIDLAEENRFQETRLIEKSLANIQNEFRQLAGAAAAQQDANASGVGYMQNFSLQVRQDQDAKIFFVYVAVNGTTQNYSVTTGNYMNDIINATYNVTASTPLSNGFVLQDKQAATNTYNSSANGIVSINLTYLTQGQNITEAFNITDNGKNSVVLFTDITLRSNDFVIRGKDVYNWTWPV